MGIKRVMRKSSEENVNGCLERRYRNDVTDKKGVNLGEDGGSGREDGGDYKDGRRFASHGAGWC